MQQEAKVGLFCKHTCGLPYVVYNGKGLVAHLRDTSIAWSCSLLKYSCKDLVADICTRDFGPESAVLDQVRRLVKDCR